MEPKLAQFTVNEYGLRDYGLPIHFIRKSLHRTVKEIRRVVARNAAGVVNLLRNLLHPLSGENEIAEAVKDRFALVDFDSAEDMRPMADEGVCSRIDASVGEFRKKGRGDFAVTMRFVRMDSHEHEVGISAGPPYAGNNTGDISQLRRRDHIGRGSGKKFFANEIDNSLIFRRRDEALRSTRKQALLDLFQGR